MGEVICPANELKEIHVDRLLMETMKMKHANYRLSQACCAYVNGLYELSYSFAPLDQYEFVTLRVIVEKGEEVPSITEIYPYAFLYENEMKELFGVNIQMINLDYENKLYRITRETPFVKEGK